MKPLAETLNLMTRSSPTGDLDAQLQHIASTCERAALGDLEARLIGFSNDPVLGPVARAINQLLDVADAYVRESSAAMSLCSQGTYERPILCQGLAGSYRKAAVTINRAALQMKTSAGQIAEFQRERERVVKEVTETTGSIAAACEELSATTNEIARQAGLSSELTHTAVAETDRTLTAMEALVKATQQIDCVVTLISQIASQTKLLALNASIESARAGVHGACFNVVAQEVKNLSQDTTKAIENIVSQVELLRHSSTNAQTAIQGIGKFIHQIHGNTAGISTAVREQVEATGEISRRMEVVVATMRDLGGSGKQA